MRNPKAGKGYGWQQATIWSKLDTDGLVNKATEILTTMRDDAARCLGTVQKVPLHKTKDGRRHMVLTLKGWSNRFLSNAIDVGLILSELNRK